MWLVGWVFEKNEGDGLGSVSPLLFSHVTK